MNNQTKIIMIDYDEVDVRTVRRAFRRSPRALELHVSKDGLDGLTMLRNLSSNGPLLILLDLNMPRMNGLEFLDELRADSALQHHVVFVLTTSDAERDKRASYARNVAGYLLKSEVGAKPEILTGLLSSYLAAVHLPS